MGESTGEAIKGSVGRARWQAIPRRRAHLMLTLLLLLGWATAVVVPDLVVRRGVLDVRYFLSAVCSLGLWLSVVALMAGSPRPVRAALATVAALVLTLTVVGSIGYHQSFQKDPLPVEWEFVLENPRWALALAADAARPAQLVCLACAPFVLGGTFYVTASHLRLPAARLPLRLAALPVALILGAIAVYGLKRSLPADIVGLRAVVVGTYSRYGRGGEPRSLPPPRRLVLPSRPPQRNPNVLLVIHESLGRDQAVGPHGQRRLARFMGKHRDRTVWFPHTSAVATATSVAVPALLSGLEPQAPREHFKRAPLLWHAARAFGYDTGLFTAQDWSIDFFTAFFLGPDRPDVTRTATDYRQPVNRVNELGVPDDLAVDAALDFIRSPRDRPFLTVVQMNATHWPCWAPELATAHWQHGMVTRPDSARCGAAARYVDTQVGRLLDELESSGALEDTLVVITSDHGEVFRSDRPPRRYSFFEDVLAIPLVLHVPAALIDEMPVLLGNARQRCNQLDIVPTLLDLWGVWPTPPVASWPTLTGHSLLRPLPQRRLVSVTDSSIGIEPAGFALYTGSWKWSAQAGLGLRLSNLEDDPDERVDLSARAPAAVRRQLDQELEQRPHLREMIEPGPSGETVGLSPAQWRPAM